MRMVCGAVLVGLLIAPAGCGFVQRSFKSSQPPVVTVDRVTVERARQGGSSSTDGAGSSHGTLGYIELVLENPNADELPLVGVTYEATFSDGSGSFAFSGERSAQATLGRFGVQRLVLPVPIPSSAISAPSGYRVRGTLEYLKPSAIASTLHENGLGGSTVPFGAEGTIAPIGQ